MAKRIAIVEDEPAIRENYADALRKQGYEVEMLGNREQALKAFKRQLPDLVLLDIGLEDEIDGGFEVCRVLRSISKTLPIIFLTARDSDLDAISGLRLGADDYLTKDISIPNLCARISAFFRRVAASQEPPESENILERGPLSLDMNRFAVTWNKSPIDLTLTEFWLVHTLALRPGHVKNREQLMQDAKIVVDDATITSHIKRIRNKFIAVDKSFDCIDTVYGMGYRWVE
ncbi:MAG: proteobacterial dedicated sortase system response regulator [Gammaproteobacteria bacterium]|nr:proteobacterial dedicated sortase system response regulator [Gammaproteobacteria bacterium]MDH5802323.1 proteobacterial dedicated sortase system response regulator [Gammaproteobacteria bacterium]